MTSKKKTIDVKDLNLIDYVFETNEGEYLCLFCVSFKTRSRQLMNNHIERLHESETVRAGSKKLFLEKNFLYLVKEKNNFFIDHYFVGCCCGDTKQRTTATSTPLTHYHCLCNIIFLSRKAITGHVMSGACTGRYNFFQV